MLSLQEVTVRYRERKALDSVTLEIKKGEFISLMGPNGSGKTTLLSLLTGLISPSSGKIVREISQAEMGFLPQEVSIDRRFPVRVRDVVFMGRVQIKGPFKRFTRDDFELIERVMEDLRIRHLEKRPFGYLSGGEKKKVLIAKALVSSPSLLLLDEPTTDLDPPAQEEMIEIVERIYRERKITIIWVCHILSHLPSFTARLVFLKDGKKIWEGDPGVNLEEFYA